MATPPPLERAIDETLALVRVELMRLYRDNDIGTIVVHVGKKQMRVEATPKRTHDAVSVEA